MGIINRIFAWRWKSIVALGRRHHFKKIKEAHRTSYHFDISSVLESENGAGTATKWTEKQGNQAGEISYSVNNLKLFCFFHSSTQKHCVTRTDFIFCRQMAPSSNQQDGRYLKEIYTLCGCKAKISLRMRTTDKKTVFCYIQRFLGQISIKHKNYPSVPRKMFTWTHDKC